MKVSLGLAADFDGMRPNAIRWQGIAFCAVAATLAIATLILPRPSERAELVVLTALIALLGAPHGALDTVFALRLYRVRGFGGWIAFTAIYCTLAFGVVALWYAVPTLFLAGFLTISAFHFSGDPIAGTPWPSRLVYGGAIVVLPTLLHADEVTHVFAFLVGPAGAEIIVPGLHFLAPLWFFGLMIAAVHRAVSDHVAGVEMAAVGALAIVATPLLAFTVFFCGMHSARHILRAFAYAGRSSPRLLAAAAVMPMLGILMLSTAAWYWLRAVPLDERIVQLVFIGLASLTAPHMALVEQVRLSGWAKGAVALEVG